MPQSDPPSSPSSISEPKEIYPSLVPYSAFMSVVFGVFVSVWIQPLSDSRVTSGALAFAGVPWVAVTHGAPMFLTLISLWWWYAMFLGRCHPSNTFYMYTYDFLSLVVFAIGFRFWHRNGVLALIIPLDSFLVCWRIFVAKHYYIKQYAKRLREDRVNRDLRATRIAIRTAAGIFTISFVVLISDALRGYFDLHRMAQSWLFILLFAGFIATVWAAVIVDGPPQSLGLIQSIWNDLRQFAARLARSDESGPSLPSRKASGESPSNKKRNRVRSPRSITNPASREFDEENTQ